MKSICVYCGSSMGNTDRYPASARAMAAELVRQGISLVYGGGRVGLMGVIADEVLRLGGEVTGVIPDALMKREVGHHGLTKLHVVRDMHERKALMAELSDAFIALPGGIGTLEELFETTTWSQLGLHDKPVGLLNVDGFYDGLTGFMQHMVTQGFLRQEHAQLMLHDPDPASLLEKMRTFVPGIASKWLDQASAKKIAP
ncbi:LOG family protein [Lacisediminimonas profundi]|uniref:LOG family protein n=1 Tax=Lacisediminimonas profundi TaxID=2603856 RepID=UPI00124B9F42|nr:TIGR00730 family Rossman fold protein [Lacisediminimonas profundi]